MPTATMAGRRLASIAYGATYADICTRTLRRYVHTGRITGYRLGPRLIRVDLDEIDAKLLQPIPTDGEVTADGDAA